MYKTATLSFLMGFNIIAPLWSVLDINRVNRHCTLYFFISSHGLDHRILGIQLISDSE